jgi:hypothetical protein
MPMNPRGMVSANQLAREYGASLNAFANDLVTLLAQLDDGAIAASPADRCRESCAAVWAGMVSSLDSSALTAHERARLTTLLLEVLVPFWRKHCADEPDIPALLARRASEYLQRRDASSQIKTAANLVNNLMSRLGVSAATRIPLGKTLTALFAHRMLGDVHDINAVRARFGIELPLVAALTAIVQMTMTCEPVMRILRLV